MCRVCGIYYFLTQREPFAIRYDSINSFFMSDIEFFLYVAF